MVQYLNRVVIGLARNGSTVHTVDPSSSGTVLEGTAFTPTAGRVLVAHVVGAVTSTGAAGGTGTSAPTGWTLPTGASSVVNSGVYMFMKTAAGSDTLVLNHNGGATPGYPVVVEFLEFPAGTTFVKAGNNSTAGPSANAAIAATIGTHTFLATVAGYANPNTAAGATVAGPPTYAGSPTPSALANERAVSATTDGYGFVSAYADDTTATSWTPTISFTLESGVPTKETVSYALNVPAGGTNYTASPGEPVGVTDATSAVAAAARTAADPVGMTDATSAAVAAARSNDDPVGLTDITVVATGFIRSTSDPIGMTDAAALSVAAARSADDPAGITDAASLVVIASRTPGDPVGIIDLLVQQVDLQRATADTIAVTDSVTAAITMAGNLSYDDPVGVTDSASSALAFARASMDAVGVADAVTAVITSAGAIAPADPVGLTDAITIVMSRVVTVADFLALADEAIASTGLPLRDITVVVGAPSSNPFSAGDAVGHPFTVSDPVGSPLRSGAPWR